MFHHQLHVKSTLLYQVLCVRDVDVHQVEGEHVNSQKNTLNQANNSDVVLETRVLVSRLSFNVSVLALGHKSIGLSLVLDHSSLGSWSPKFSTMYETTIFPKGVIFFPKTSFSGFFGGTLAALQYFFYYLQQLQTSRKSLRTNVHCVSKKFPPLRSQ